MSNVLEIDSIIKAFNGRQILTDIYLKCTTGEIIGLLGRNGTGKSTLLKIIFGVLWTDNKFIRIDGKVLTQPYKISNELCYLPQHNFLPKQFSVKKVAKLYLPTDQINSFLDDSILRTLINNKTGNLSGGELRYLEIKLLLNTDCKFLLLDEPFNGVSPLMIDSLKELITEKAKVKGIILTDHDYRNVLDVATRYCLIFDGGIKEVKDKAELVKWGYLSESRI
ncbi:MAG TPA: ATP-binding cassette domain-containing protein [Bacteroidales bacterium]